MGENETTQLTATVTHDTTNREIGLKLSGGHVLTARSGDFRAERVGLHIFNGECRWIKISGGRALKDGGFSSNVSRSVTWGMGDIDEAPTWVREIWRDAPDGVSEFSWPDGKL